MDTPTQQLASDANDLRTTKSPTSRRRPPHFGAISRSPTASLKSPAFLLDQCQVTVETLALHFDQLILSKFRTVATRCQPEKWESGREGANEGRGKEGRG